jgi:hypothetical protein
VYILSTRECVSVIGSQIDHQGVLLSIVRDLPSLYSKEPVSSLLKNMSTCIKILNFMVKSITIYKDVLSTVFLVNEVFKDVRMFANILKCDIHVGPDPGARSPQFSSIGRIYTIINI